jgi:hypothetical protein
MEDPTPTPRIKALYKCTHCDNEFYSERYHLKLCVACSKTEMEWVTVEGKQVPLARTMKDYDLYMKVFGTCIFTEQLT